MEEEACLLHVHRRHWRPDPAARDEVRGIKEGYHRDCTVRHARAIQRLHVEPRVHCELSDLPKHLAFERNEDQGIPARSHAHSSHGYVCSGQDRSQDAYLPEDHPLAIEIPVLRDTLPAQRDHERGPMRTAGVSVRR